MRNRVSRKYFPLLFLVLVLAPVFLNGLTKPDWVQIKNKPVYSIRNFGGIPDDGIADDAAYTAALASISASDGGTLEFAEGTYNFNACINTVRYMALRGAGKTTLSFGGLATAGIFMEGDGYNQISGFWISGHATMPAIIGDLRYSSISDIIINNVFCGMEFYKGISSKVENVRVVLQATGAIGLKVGSATIAVAEGDTGIPTTMIFSNVSLESASTSIPLAIGIRIAHGETLLFNQCLTQVCDIGIQLPDCVNNVTYGYGRWITFIAPYFEQCTTNITTVGCDYQTYGERLYLPSERTKFTRDTFASVTAQTGYFNSKTSKTKYKRNVLSVASYSVGSYTRYAVNYGDGAESTSVGGFAATYDYTGNHKVDIGGFGDTVASHIFLTQDTEVHFLNASLVGNCTGTGSVELYFKCDYIWETGVATYQTIAATKQYFKAGATDTIQLSSMWLPPRGSRVYVEVYNNTVGTFTVTSATGISYFEMYKP